MPPEDFSKLNLDQLNIRRTELLDDLHKLEQTAIDQGVSRKDLDNIKSKSRDLARVEDLIRRHRG